MCICECVCDWCRKRWEMTIRVNESLLLKSYKIMLHSCETEGKSVTLFLCPKSHTTFQNFLSFPSFKIAFYKACIKGVNFANWRCSKCLNINMLLSKYSSALTELLPFLWSAHITQADFSAGNVFKCDKV